MKSIIKSLALASIALLVASCNQEAKWSVAGHITDADGSLLTLERSYNGRWIVLDSTRLDDKGEYKFKSDPTGYPDIYRLSINGQSAYFPIDSLDNVIVNGSANAFASNYELSGTDNAIAFQEINSLINAKVAQLGNQAVNDSILKRQLAEIILADMGGVNSYYLINKEIGGHPIFNANNRDDLRVIGAVVNSFSSLRPNDPRTRIMTEAYIAARRAANPATQTIEALEIGYPDITLQGVDGKEHSLSELTGKGHPVIVNFTAYSTESSPAINLALANIYNAGGVDIYQVSIDTDEYMWREAARNLPWTAVFKSPKDGDRVLREYNVSVIPTSFIIDRNGRLQERVDDITKLASLVNKYK